jgi:hypothetical protein
MAWSVSAPSPNHGLALLLIQNYNSSFLVSYLHIHHETSFLRHLFGAPILEALRPALQRTQGQCTIDSEKQVPKYEIWNIDCQDCSGDCRNQKSEKKEVFREAVRAKEGEEQDSECCCEEAGEEQVLCEEGAREWCVGWSEELWVC